MPVTAEQAQWRTEELQRWLTAGVCERDDSMESGITHPLLLVDKAGWQDQPTAQLQWEKKFRKCLAVRKWANKALDISRLRMETLAVALRSVWPGDVLAKGDLKNGYHHLLLHVRCRRFWRFKLNGVTY